MNETYFLDLGCAAIIFIICGYFSVSLFDTIVFFYFRFLEKRYKQAIAAIEEYNDELRIVYPHDQRRISNRINPNEAMYSFEYTKKHFYKGVRAIVRQDYISALTPYARWIK